MIITLNDTGKKFEREWIFKSLSFTLKSGDRLVVKGGNGSGKSTILQILLGKSIPTKGSIEYKLNDTVIESQKVFSQTCIASPFLELIFGQLSALLVPSGIAAIYVQFPTR